MSQESKTLSANVPAESKLIDDFEDYYQRSGTKSKAEAIRTLIRDGLDKQGDQPADDTVTSDSNSDVIRGNEGFLLALVFLFQSDAVLSTTISGFGQFWGPIVYAVVGVAIVLVMFYQTAWPLLSDELGFLGEST